MRNIASNPKGITKIEVENMVLVLMGKDYAGELGVDGKLILWRVEPLLCNDDEMSKYTRAVSRYRLGKHVPTATNTHATIEKLLETGCFCMVRAKML
jgi:hypothetical protein